MLKVDCIHKSFDKNKIVDGISFNVKKGEIYGLLGPNGAGKTSILRMINKISIPEVGSIFFNNEVLQYKHLMKIGYLPEERGLYKEMTVFNHLLLLARLKGLEKKEAICNVDFWLNKLEIIFWKKKKICELSKGMAQKIQFIACLIHNPDLIILDEPFSGFDPLNIDVFEKILFELKKEGKSIIISSHNLKSVESLCDRAILINKGRVLLEGSVQEWKVKMKKNLFSVIFKGNMLVFANALWSNFELIDSKELSNDTFHAIVMMRNENNFQDLLRTLINHVEIVKAEEVFPDLQQIFVDILNENKLINS